MREAPSPLSEAEHEVQTVDGARLHVTTRGPDDAAVTVILAHGWTLSSRIWRVQSVALTEHDSHRIRVIRWDQRGHGQSTLGSSDLSMEILGDDLVAIIENLVPTGPIVLAGHSMGGMTIMAMAADHPDLVRDRVAGVAFVSTTAGNLDTRLPGNSVLSRLAGAAQWQLMNTLSRRPQPIDLLRTLAPPRLWVHQAAVRKLLFGTVVDAEAVRECAEIIHATPTQLIGAFYAPLLAHDKMSKLDVLRDKPVAILVGALDRLTPPRHSRALAQALPGAKLMVLQDRGHMLPLGAAEVVTQQLLDLCSYAVRAT